MDADFAAALLFVPLTLVFVGNVPSRASSSNLALMILRGGEKQLHLLIAR
jgi:hypothetical protein